MTKHIKKSTEVYYYIFCMFHLGSIITGMTVTSRIISINLPYIDNQFVITGGMFFIPVVFFIQDIVTEEYGYNNARRMLNLNLTIFSLYSLLFWIISLIPNSNQGYAFQNLQNVASTLPRHTLSFVLSLALGGRVNNYILWKLKLISNNKFLAIRFISATAIGEAFFQIIAILISWYGVYPSKKMCMIALTSYLYKILFEIVVTPLNIIICAHIRSLKIKEFGYVF